MPSTRQGANSSNSKRPTRRSASVNINYAEDNPKKISKAEPSDVKKNLEDAWSLMGKSCKVDLGKNKLPSSTTFVIGNKRATTVKLIDPDVITLDQTHKKFKTNSVLPKSLLITKISDTASNGPVSTPKQGVTKIQKQSAQVLRQVSLIQKPVQSKLTQKPLAFQNSESLLSNVSLPGVTIQRSQSTPVKTEALDIESITTETPIVVDKENITFGTRVRNIPTPLQKKRLIETPTLTRSSGRILKKPSIINSQKKAIVKTIKNLNQDQKKRIEERLGDIGSNLQKLKPKEDDEQTNEISLEPVIEKKSLKEVLTDADWLNMFLQTEPTAAYNAATDTLYCKTCKDLLEEDFGNDGWVVGHHKGVEWLKYSEHKLGEEHQKTSTKYFLQLFTAHVRYA